MELWTHTEIWLLCPVLKYAPLQKYLKTRQWATAHCWWARCQWLMEKKVRHIRIKHISCLLQLKISQNDVKYIRFNRIYIYDKPGFSEKPSRGAFSENKPEKAPTGRLFGGGAVSRKNPVNKHKVRRKMKWIWTWRSWKYSSNELNTVCLTADLYLT